MVTLSIHNRLENLKQKGAIPAWILFGLSVLLYVWEIAGNVSTAAWLYGLLPSSWKRMPQMDTNFTVGLAGSVPFWMFLAALIWLGILAFVPPKRRHGIVGGADLLIIRLDLTDIRFDRGWDGSTATTGLEIISLGTFIRMWVGVTDEQRTVRKFVVEATAPDSTVYRAESEWEFGKFYHRHVQTSRDSLGYVIDRTLYEPMEDLAAKLRTPVQPNTHREGWIRFELKNVKHELKNCSIKIHAVDVSGDLHEIKADGMQVREVADHEFASATQQSTL